MTFESDTDTVNVTSTPNFQVKRHLVQNLLSGHTERLTRRIDCSTRAIKVVTTLSYYERFRFLFSVLTIFQIYSNSDRVEVFQRGTFGDSWNDFTARRHASAVYAVVMCLSVYLSQVGVLLKRLNVGSRKQRQTIAEGL